MPKNIYYKLHLKHELEPVAVKASNINKEITSDVL